MFVPPILPPFAVADTTGKVLSKLSIAKSARLANVRSPRSTNIGPPRLTNIGSARSTSVRPTRPANVAWLSGSPDVRPSAAIAGTSRQIRRDIASPRPHTVTESAAGTILQEFSCRTAGQRAPCGGNACANT
jgi:hypothetical protein